MRPAPLNPYFARWVGRARPRAATAQPRVLCIYATVTGTAKALAMEVRSGDSDDIKSGMKVARHVGHGIPDPHLDLQACFHRTSPETLTLCRQLG